MRTPAVAGSVPGEKLAIWALTLLAVLVTSPALADRKHYDSATLNDVRPAVGWQAGDKHAVYDMLVVADGTAYQCRYDGHREFKPSNFIIGSGVEFRWDSQRRGHVRSLFNKEEVSCQILRARPVPMEEASLSEEENRVGYTLGM